jgi:tungstate transport system ATP-binding protein
MSPAPLFKLQDISVAYEGRLVLDIPYLEIIKGEIFALVGPSGAGKSTLLRLLNFLEPPASGNIEFDGKTYEGGLAAPLWVRRRVTTVFQRPMLLNQSVWNNVAYGLRLRSERNRNMDIQAALTAVGLTDMKNQRARTLSGGEAQRVSLARAMVICPDVLLLDEPTANLDPYNVHLIEKIMGQLNQESGTTLVLVTHNVFQARRLANRVGFLLDGKLVEVAEVENFFKEPADPRTLAFVQGDMVY